MFIQYEIELYRNNVQFLRGRYPVSRHFRDDIIAFTIQIITGRTIICPLIFAEDKNTLLHKLQRIEIWRRKINDKNNERWRISWTWINGRGLHIDCESPLLKRVGVHWQTATKKDNSCWQRIVEEALVIARNYTNGHSVFHLFLHAFCYIRNSCAFFSYTWPVNLGLCHWYK